MTRTQTSRSIDFIVVHCTAGNKHAAVFAVRKVFRERGWIRPGYHYLVTSDGQVHNLWSESERANGAKGYNSRSIHIAYTGGVNQSDMRTPEDTRTEPQRKALAAKLLDLKRRYPKARVLGHRDLPGVDKACPSFNVVGEYGADFCRPWQVGESFSPAKD